MSIFETHSQGMTTLGINGGKHKTILVREVMKKIGSGEKGTDLSHSYG